MKKIILFAMFIVLFVMVTVTPGITSSQQQDDSAVAEEANAEEQNLSEPDSMIDVSGVVTLIDSDSDGNPDQVRVQNHIISEYGRGLDLFEYAGKKVHITGELFVDGDGQVLDVISYEVDEENATQ